MFKVKFKFSESKYPKSIEKEPNIRTARITILLDVEQEVLKILLPKNSFRNNFYIL